MSVLLRFLSLMLSLVTTSVHAGGESPFPCRRDGNQQELNACALQDFQKADAALNRTYRRLLAGLSEDRQTALRQEQRSWLEKRDPQCEAQTADSKGGSIWPLEYYGCLEDVTKARTRELGQRRHAQ